MSDNAAATEKRLRVRMLTTFKGKYAKIVDRIQNIIEEKNVDIERLILNLCASDEENVTVFSSDKAFVTIKNTNDLFLWIGKYCNMYDFDLLLALVESTECQEAIKLLDDFTEELRSSILKDLDLLSEDGTLLDPKDFMHDTHKLVIKYVGGRCTLPAKEKVQNIIYECFQLKKGSIIFKGVQEGCVAFVYQISPAVKSYLLQITPHDATVFAEHHIISILIDDVVLKVPQQSKEVCMTNSSPVAIIINLLFLL